MAPSRTSAQPRDEELEAEKAALLREIDTLKHHLEARRASERPLRASLVGAYREALERCYERLDEH